MVVLNKLDRMLSVILTFPFFQKDVSIQTGQWQKNFSCTVDVFQTVLLFVGQRVHLKHA